VARAVDLSVAHGTSADPTTATIVSFLGEIGLDVQARAIEVDTFLPGITVDDGVLIYDPAALQHPGDLLHEAGHLAVKPTADRDGASADLGKDAAEEMMAIAWSYAAAVHLGIPAEVVFHPDGYKGGSKSLIENFAEGRYLAVPMLQWLGMTHDAKRAAELGVAPYPQMTRWLRDA
jgi:hypothetical protein